MKPNQRRDLLPGIIFLMPNILGVLGFVLFPVVFSLYMSFTNWDIRFHNAFRNETAHWVGLAQYAELLQEEDAWRFFGNTLFLMLGIPPAIIGSLLLAVLLQKLARERQRFAGSSNGSLLLSGALTGAALVLAALLSGGRGTPLFLLSCFAGILFLGTLAWDRLYVALFYLPNFTAGVATFVLWKKLYHPQTGPINAALSPLLDILSQFVQALPSASFQLASLLALALIHLIAAHHFYRLNAAFISGEIDTLGFIVGAALLLLVPGYLLHLNGFPSASLGIFGILVAFLIGLLVRAHFIERRLFRSNEANGSHLLFCSLLMTAQWILLGSALVLSHLPEWSADGLVPPNWLTDYHWAKPALIIMGIWMTIGSSNMILYLAGLTTIDRQLYEAAEVDGATGMTCFWHITIPHLTPITVFIVVMSMIAGLQGGFEMARTMTYGGPAGATTTLSYYLYSAGFEQGRFGYASAIAWVLFMMLFAATIAVIRSRGSHAR